MVRNRETKTDEKTTKPSVPKVPLEPPDSGWAWMVLIGGFILQFTVIGFIASVSVYVYVWMEYFEGSAAETSLVVSVCSFMMGFLSEYCFHNKVRTKHFENTNKTVLRYRPCRLCLLLMVLV